jgi:hypothetical protein
MLNDLKEFEKFLKICRKQGVKDVTFSGVSVTLGDLPAKSSQQEESDEIPTDELSPEQMMFYAVNGGN